MNIIYYNGAYIADTNALISPHDCGFTTAIGIFDSMLALDGTPQHINEHYARIMHDAQTVIGICPEISAEQFTAICDKLLKKNNLHNGAARIRTTITGGVVTAPLTPATTTTVLIHTAATDTPDPNPAPIKGYIIDDFPRIAGCILENCKRLDYSRSYAARQKAKQYGADEAIITNTNGDIACGATSNIFIKEGDTFITPPLSDGVLAGVTRKKLIQEQDACEETITRERLQNADQIYLTNSFWGLREVVII